MAMHKSMLEEFGLGTVWVRRETAPAAAAHREGPGAQVPDPEASMDSKGEATLTALDAVLSAAQKSHGNARQAPPADFDAPRAKAAQFVPLPSAEAEPPVFDDLPWLDDVPMQPPAAPNIIDGDDTAADIASLDWDTLAARVSVCQRCRLCERRTNAVFGVGDRDADWMLIGEAPGENEDKQGEPFVGQAGKLLDSMLQAVALSREDNVFIANVIKCRPPGNRNPELDEVARCEPYLKRQVELVKPKLIVALGRFAAQSLLKTEASISSLRGRVHDYQGVPVIVTYHPAYLLRSLPDKAKAWADLCLAQATYRESLKAANGA
jgi:uracil-DNA glycosylase